MVDIPDHNIFVLGVYNFSPAHSQDYVYGEKRVYKGTWHKSSSET